jgi:hypothetical protein
MEGAQAAPQHSGSDDEMPSFLLAMDLLRYVMKKDENGPAPFIYRYAFQKPFLLSKFAEKFFATTNRALRWPEYQCTCRCEAADARTDDG